MLCTRVCECSGVHDAMLCIAMCCHAGSDVNIAHGICPCGESMRQAKFRTKKATRTLQLAVCDCSENETGDKTVLIFFRSGMTLGCCGHFPTFVACSCH